MVWEPPWARPRVQPTFWLKPAAQAGPAPESDTAVTCRRLSTESVRWIPTASEGPLLVTLTVKVCPEVPASTEGSWNSFFTARDTERWTSTESEPVASVGWPAAEAVAVLLTVAGLTEEATA